MSDVDYYRTVVGAVMRVRSPAGHMTGNKAKVRADSQDSNPSPGTWTGVIARDIGVLLPGPCKQHKQKVHLIPKDCPSNLLSSLSVNVTHGWDLRFVLQSCVLLLFVHFLAFVHR